MVTLEELKEGLNKALKQGFQEPLERTLQPAQRYLAVGDPQTRFEHFLECLRHHQLLSDDGLLRPELRLVSMGDHFDFAAPKSYSMAKRSRDGLHILMWLALHPREQVIIVLGNHDLCRVQELAFESDASFAEAHKLGWQLRRLGKSDERAAKELTEGFHERFPHIPSPGIAAIDFSAFCVAQRRLVQELLLAQRVVLAWTAKHAGQELLVNHAGLTQREAELLAPAQGPRALARALNERLRAAVDELRADWQAGQPRALSLAPLHVPGITGQEGGGLLYHRPAQASSDKWSNDPRFPRRYDPRSLVPGLWQLVGHTQHRKCLKELGPWASGARQGSDFELRSLRVEDQQVSYEMGLPKTWRGAGLLMVDAAMNKATPEQSFVFELDELSGGLHGGS